MPLHDEVSRNFALVITLSSVDVPHACLRPAPQRRLPGAQT